MRVPQSFGAPARAAVLLAVAGLSVFGLSPVHAQTAPQAPAREPGPARERQLSLTEAVGLALEQNADLQVERINPQLQELGISLARSNWTPNFVTTYTGVDQSTQPNNLLLGGVSNVTNNQNGVNVALQSATRWGGNYSVGFNNQRGTTNNAFALFNPQLNSTFQAQYQQSLLRNFSIDQTRQQIMVTQKNREISEVGVRQAVALTTRNVRNAYWDLVGARDNLSVQRLSLDLAQRSLKENRARVEIGTMAPIDIVQAEAEVAQREESVIVAEAAIDRAEDRLRALIYGEHLVEEWNTRIVPSDPATFAAVPVDIDGAVRAAIDQRSDINQAQKTIEANDVSVRFLRNQVKPDVLASLSYSSAAAGGTGAIRGEGFPGPIIDTIQRPWGDVLSDVFGNQFPTWNFQVQFSYPIGTANAEANLARARLQTTQTQKQLDALRIRVATEVREAGRQVTANGKRVEATRASRALAEKRLEAEEKKFQAGMSTSFLVFQAQRDLNQARNNELQALIDYNKSVVDFETAQVAPLTGAPPGIGTVNAFGGAGGTLNQIQTNQQQRQQQ